MSSIVGLVSFEDVSVDFTWDEWQDLDDSQRKLYRDVMLETYSSLLSLNQCDAKPELILKLEQGAGPWKEDNAPDQSLPALQPMKSLKEARRDTGKKHLSHLLVTGSASAEERGRLGEILSMNSNHVLHLALKTRSTSRMRSEVLDTWGDVYLPGGPIEMQATEELDHLNPSKMLPRPPAPLSLDFSAERGPQHGQCAQHGEAFDVRTVWTRTVFPLGDSSTNAFDKLALTAQEGTHIREETFDCNMCKKPFSDTCNHTRHLKPHLKKQCGKCPDGEPAFRAKAGLQHTLHSWGKPRGCNDNKKCVHQMPKPRSNQSVFSSKESNCVKTFCPDSTLSVQQRPHTGKKPQESSTPVKINSQPRRRHRCGRTYQCKVCGKAFKHTQNLYLHHRTHTGEKPYECKECGKAFSHSSSFRKHERTHTGERPYVCKQCGKAFNCSGSIRKHERTHTGEKPYSCKQCGKAFNCPSYLQIHERSHTGEKPYECKQCGKTFSCSSSLRKHERTHTGEKPYECKQCGKAFSCSSSFRKHERTHTGEKPYECKQCGKAFFSLTSVRTHMIKHTGNGPFKCNVCEEVFPFSSVFRRHQSSHAGEKQPYGCKQCNKWFSSNTSLQNHRRSHTGEEPYAYKQCGKAFSCPSYIRKHERAHSGEKPYPCKQCGKCFSASSSLQTHERIHAGEKPYKREQGARAFSCSTSLRPRCASTAAHSVSFSL